MIGSRPRHRHALVLPFVLLALVLVGGGILNSVDVSARVVDGLTEKGVKDALITHGVRSALSDDDGRFVLTNVPRTSKINVNARGYQVTSPPATVEEIRLSPLSVTIYVWDQDKEPPDNAVPSPQARQDTRVLGSGGVNGQMVIAPHPGKDAKLLICAEGYRSKEITVEGVLMEVTLEAAEGEGCPPLPTPTPAPNESPSPSPSPEPEPTPTPTPEPTGTP